MGFSKTNQTDDFQREHWKMNECSVKRLTTELSFSKILQNPFKNQSEKAGKEVNARAIYTRN
jgi:hypothetical protein